VGEDGREKRWTQPLPLPTSNITAKYATPSPSFLKSPGTHKPQNCVYIPKPFPFFPSLIFF
jgi:hypothetical protein